MFGDDLYSNGRGFWDDRGGEHAGRQAGDWAAEGGLLEIIEDTKNGLLLKPGFSVNDVCAAVRQLTPERASAMESACAETAKKFSEKSFVEGMKKVIEEFPPEAGPPMAERM